MNDKEKRTENSESTDDRSAIAKAVDKASMIISACLAMVVPAVLGYFADNYLGTNLVFTLVGFFVGIISGGWLLYRLVQTLAKQD